MVLLAGATEFIFLRLEGDLELIQSFCIVLVFEAGRVNGKEDCVAVVCFGRCPSADSVRFAL